jgi:hypothetical protein
MKVGELIAALQTMPPDADVGVCPGHVPHEVSLNGHQIKVAIDEETPKSVSGLTLIRMPTETNRERVVVILNPTMKTYDRSVKPHTGRASRLQRIVDASVAFEEKHGPMPPTGKPAGKIP